MGKLFEELKRRKVFRVAAVYAVVAWVLIQVADTVLPALQMPQWTVSFVTVLFILGFLPTLIAAWAYEITPEGIKADAQTATGSTATAVQPINYLILAIVLLMAGAQLGDRLLFSSGDNAEQTATTISANSRAIRSNINLGYMDAPESFRNNFVTTFDFTPDGSSLVFSSFEEGVYRLFVRNLESLESELILESSAEAIAFPTVSPDGSWIAYVTRFPSNLHIVNTRSGSTRLLIEDVMPNSVAWLDADSIVYTKRNVGGLLSIYSLGSRQSTPLNQAETSRASLGSSERSQRPSRLPGSDSLLLTVAQGRGNSEPRVEAFDMATEARRLLLDNAYSAVYVETGHLVFMRGIDLYAVPFDVENLEMKGAEVPLIEGIESSAETLGAAAFSVSKTGQLAYLPGAQIFGRGERQLVWLERDGSEQALDLPAQYYSDPVISPDGKRLAVIVLDDGQSDIWVHDFAQPGIINRVSNSGDAFDPLWTPDGQSLIFSQSLSTGLGQVNANGIGIAESYLDSSELILPRTFDSDGSLLFVNAGVLDGQRASRGIRRLDKLNLDNPVQLVLGSNYDEIGPSVSPDGRFLAYSSNETGAMEVYIRPYPDVGTAKWRVSVNGGAEPRWGKNGNTLHYASGQFSYGRGLIISAEIQMAPEFMVLNRTEVELGEVAFSGTPSYALGESDDRFLVMRASNREARQAREINFGQEPVLAVLVDNFFEELKRLAPRDVP